MKGQPDGASSVRACVDVRLRFRPVRDSYVMEDNPGPLRLLQCRAEIHNFLNHTMLSSWNIQPTCAWRNWLHGRLVQPNANLSRFVGTLNQPQMSVPLRFQF